MARERTYDPIGPVAFTADGQDNGIITIDDTFCFKVKMDVVLKADGMEAQRFEIKRVLSKTQMILGAENKSLHSRSNLTAYVMGINPTVEASEQDRPNIPPADYERASFEEEPTLAKRVFNVDKYGKAYTVGNPFPVRLSDGSVHIGTVNAELEVQLSHKADTPDAGDIPDSVQVGDGVEIIQVNPDGSINVVISDAVSGTPILHFEAGAFTNLSETTVATFTSTAIDSRISKFVGEAQTFGVWKVYRGTVAPANLVVVKRTSPMERTAEYNFDQPEKLSSIGNKLIVTFQAERYRAFLLTATATTFVRLEGSY
tara:strand:- start:4943 stop:5884 length:942 start_codon:yes stop_codon:yes gene_type:complete